MTDYIARAIDGVELARLSDADYLNRVLEKLDVKKRPTLIHDKAQYQRRNSWMADAVWFLTELQANRAHPFVVDLVRRYEATHENILAAG